MEKVTVYNFSEILKNTKTQKECRKKLSSQWSHDIYGEGEFSPCFIEHFHKYINFEKYGRYGIFTEELLIYLLDRLKDSSINYFVDDGLLKNSRLTEDMFICGKDYFHAHQISRYMDRYDVSEKFIDTFINTPCVHNIVSSKSELVTDKLREKHKDRIEFIEKFNALVEGKSKRESYCLDLDRSIRVDFILNSNVGSETLRLLCKKDNTFDIEYIFYSSKQEGRPAMMSAKRENVTDLDSLVEDWMFKEKVSNLADRNRIAPMFILSKDKINYNKK